MPAGMTEEEIEKEVARVIAEARVRYFVDRVGAPFTMPPSVRVEPCDELQAKSVLSRLKEKGWGPLPPTR